MSRLFALLLVILLVSFPCLIIAQDDVPDVSLRWDIVRKAVCLKRAKYGKCGGHRKMWYYDIYKKQCSTFTYSNCGGNTNRFFSKEECEDYCVSSAMEQLKKKV
ncbi:kappaPI-stichotoxin-Shd2a-like [Drosophila albomicans]|uniref:KappaPI-stichotoxin-Shd2a-like n=1 Tax=Drosophila albomicans TaxID=7291 RepID=A0A6P8XKE4_DROAB|nr:kappaPI-stichotoxin-Shd2a-like [Drosophila albomicans]